MTYPTDLLTVNAFIISSGGTGGHATMLSALNELCTMQSVAHDHVTNLPALNALAVGLGATGGYVSNLAALNAISLVIGGTGGYHTTLAAWTEIAGLGFLTAQQKAYNAEVLQIGASIVDQKYTNTEIKKAVEDGYFDKIAFWVDNFFGKRIASGTRDPFIVFNFDDGRSQDWATYQSFVAAGLGRGTSYISGKFIGTPGYLTVEQVATMAADGWDFQCHTWSHAHSNLLPGGDVDDALGLTGCTDEQIHEELQKNNEAFIALGLPIPKHLAYPNYITDWDRVTPIVAMYRHTMRVGGGLLVSKDYVDSLCPVSWRGMNAAAFDNTDLAVNKAFIDVAIDKNEICMFEGHGTSEPYFSELLDYVYSKGLIPHTVSEMWDYINSRRNKLVNVAKGNYETLAVLDNAVQTDKQGIIIFNESCANIGATICDYYKNKEIPGCILDRYKR